MEEEFYLSRDNEGHWYVIPLENSSEWEDFLAIDLNDPESWDVPDWAEAVGGSPSLVTFTGYRID